MRLKIPVFLIVFLFLGLPLLSASDQSGVGRDAVTACINRASYLPNPGDRTEVCECIHHLRTEQQCEKWKEEMIRLKTGDYTSPPPPPEVRPDPNAACVLKAAAFITNPADRVTVCNCTEDRDSRLSKECAPWQREINHLLYGAPLDPPLSVLQHLAGPKQQIDPRVLAKAREDKITRRQGDPYPASSASDFCDTGYFCKKNGGNYRCMPGSGSEQRCWIVQELCDSWESRSIPLTAQEQAGHAKYCR